MKHKHKHKTIHKHEHKHWRKQAGKQTIQNTILDIIRMQYWLSKQIPSNQHIGCRLSNSGICSAVMFSLMSGYLWKNRNGKQTNNKQTETNVNSCLWDFCTNSAGLHDISIDATTVHCNCIYSVESTLVCIYIYYIYDSIWYDMIWYDMIL